MTVRAMLEQKKGLAVGAGAAMVLLAAGLIFWQSRGQSDGVTTPAFFFTDDDGATYFRGDKDLIPPFDHGGKQAVSAKVGRCPDNSTQVFYMQRFTPAARAVVVKIRSGDKNVSDAELQALAKGREFKQPGAKEWKAMTDNEQRAWLMGITCKDKSQPKYLDE